MNDATETAIFLRRYQSWRKGEIDVFYPDSHAGPNPVEISVAIDRAIVALEAQPPCGADGVWRPIETAPLDGRAVLVMSDNWPGTKSGRAETCNGHNTYVAEWWAESNEWMCYMSLPCEPVCPIAPTHWMPLPDVPSSQPAAPVAPAPVAVPAGYRLQPLSEYEAMRHALDMPDGDFPKWKELVIADLQTSYDSDGVTHEDSGDPLIYLQSAIAIVEDMLLPDELLASQPAAPVAPATVAVPDEWREILAELADDVKCNVAAEYPPETRHYPSQKRRFDEAMEIVLRAEAMLAASQGEGVKS